jgi:hypothetical protein
MNENQLTKDGKDYKFNPVEKLTCNHCFKMCDLFKSCRIDEIIYPCTKETRKDKRDGYFTERTNQ